MSGKLETEKRISQNAEAERSRPVKYLIVEDSLIMLSSLLFLIEESAAEGSKVFTASSIEEAQEIIEKEDPDITITDSLGGDNYRLVFDAVNNQSARRKEDKNPIIPRAVLFSISEEQVYFSKQEGIDAFGKWEINKFLDYLFPLEKQSTNS